MTKYLVTFLRRTNDPNSRRVSEPYAMIEGYALTSDALDDFMREFYPDTNWYYEVME